MFFKGVKTLSASVMARFRWMETLPACAGKNNLKEIDRLLVAEPFFLAIRLAFDTTTRGWVGHRPHRHSLP